MTKYLRVVFFGAFVVLLFGCASEHKFVAPAQNKKAQSALLHERLVGAGVNIIQNDDSMILVLPNVLFFNQDSANFTNHAYKTLDLILGFTDYYEKSVIHISGFSKNGNGKIMAEERANRVVKYLWEHGIDASFVFADSNEATLIKGSQHYSVLRDCVIIAFRKIK